MISNPLPSHTSSPSNNNKSNNASGTLSPTDVSSYPHEVPQQQQQQQQQQRHEIDENQLNDSLSKLGYLQIDREGSILDEEDNAMPINGDDDDNLTYEMSNIHEDVYHHRSSRGNNVQALNEEELSDSEYEDDIRNSYLDYQMEQEEVRREMNINKIAFAAYRNAVLHLVHNQSSFPKKNNSIDEKKENEYKGGIVYVNDDNDPFKTPDPSLSFEDVGFETPKESNSFEEFARTTTEDEEDDANERMTMIEDLAKKIVETKAKAFFEAVCVVKEFNLRREEKQKRSRILVGGLTSVGGEDMMLVELRKMRKNKKSTSVVSNGNVVNDAAIWSNNVVRQAVEENEENVVVEAKTVKVMPKVEKKVEKFVEITSPQKSTNKSTTATATATSVRTTTTSAIKKPRTKIKIRYSFPPMEGPVLRKPQPAVVGPIIRLRKKTTRNVDCTKHTLPKFQYKQPQQSNNDMDGNENKSSQAYGTSLRIKKMIHWKVEKMNYEASMLKRCGCSSCFEDLKKLNDKKMSS